MTSSPDESNSFAAARSNHRPNTRGIMHSLKLNPRSSFSSVLTNQEILSCIGRTDRTLAAAKPQQMVTRILKVLKSCRIMRAIQLKEKESTSDKLYASRVIGLDSKCSLRKMKKSPVI